MVFDIYTHVFTICIYIVFVYPSKFYNYQTLPEHVFAIYLRETTSSAFRLERQQLIKDLYNTNVLTILYN